MPSELCTVDGLAHTAYVIEPGVYYQCPACHEDFGAARLNGGARQHSVLYAYRALSRTRGRAGSKARVALAEACARVIPGDR